MSINVRCRQVNSMFFIAPLPIEVGSKKNVQSLEDYIRNDVHKSCSDEEIKLKQ